MGEAMWERRECVSAQVDGSLVLLDLETLAYHSLNSSAAAVWGMLEQPQPASALVAGLCEVYDVTPEHCADSVKRLLGELEASKLIQSKPIQPRA